MAIEAEIQARLKEVGSATTGKLARSLGYDTREVRAACKDLRDDGQIAGSKNKRIPAYIINDEYVVITESREQLLEIVRTHAPSLEDRAEAMSTDQIQDLIRDRLASREVGGPAIFEWRHK